MVIRGHRLGGDKARWLERPFEEEEVKLVVFSSDQDKSPRPDGFSTSFFQECWGVVKGDFLKVFEEFFRNGVVNSTINHTYLYLISKKTDSRRLKDYRPISLVTSIYKIIMKVLANRLREVSSDTILTSQDAFVKDRQILDVVLIANEAVEEYRSKKKRGLVFKVDFEKAYDHVKWRFLDEMLEKKGFGNKWRLWMQMLIIGQLFDHVQWET